MNPLLLYELLEALALLHSGRANDAAEALAEAIREHGRVTVDPATRAYDALPHRPTDATNRSELHGHDAQSV